MRKIGLYFGSFNPVHIGHLTIANHMVEFTDMDEVWMVVTPHNPFKKKQSLLNNYDRFEMVRLATATYDKIEPSDIEFKLKQPNYTIDTLVQLQERFPETEFALIMGMDNLKSLHKWKNYEAILEHHNVYVYPRISEGEVPNRFENHPRIFKVAAPVMEISSTFIRKSIQSNKGIRPLLDKSVWDYIDKMNFYA